MERRPRNTNGNHPKRSLQTCRFFNNPGGCRYGSNCKFKHSDVAISHDATSGNSSGSHTQSIPVNGQRDAVIQWRYLIPRVPFSAQPLGPRLQLFFQTALELIDKDAGIMQEVIMLLASEGGLVRIKELLDRDLGTVSESRSAHVLCDQLYPFMKIITHVNVATSIMLEDQVGSIYNFLYGRQGERGIKVFNHIVRALTSSPDVVRSSITSEPILSAFLSMLDMNNHAIVNEELPNIADRLFQACNDLNDWSDYQTERLITKICQRLGVGKTFESIDNLTKKPQIGTKFVLSQDLPGLLSPNGPRHDNDHASITDIRILPTSSEIKAVRQPYLPPWDPVQWHLPGIKGLLDRHFRLVREDTVGQLRDAIGAELEHTQAPKHNVARTFTYDNLRIVNIKFSRWKGLQLCVQFDQPKHLRNSSVAARKEWWEHTKRLSNDALVCIIGQQGSTVFCTVLEPGRAAHTPLGGTPQDTSVSNNTYSNPHTCYVQLHIVQDDEPTISQTLRQFEAAQIDQRLVEFPGIVLPAFKPTLEALQRMSQRSDLPFAELLLSDERSILSNSNIAPPHYAVKPGFQFQLDDIMKDALPMRYSIGQAFDIKKFKANTILDDAQADALIESIGRSFALIQGPPGTGKSFTGVALIKVLLAIKNKAKLGPILCVCFTNHALDQLLEHLVRQGVTQIIRMGSRSKSEVLQECNLHEVAKKMTMTGPERRRRWEVAQHLESDETQITEVLEVLSKPIDQQVIGNYLSMHHPAHFAELLADEEVDEDGFKTVRYNEGNEIRDWLRGDPKTASRVNHARALDTLKYSRLSGMNVVERRLIYNFWVRDIVDTLQEKLIIATQSHSAKRAEHDGLQDELNLRCLQQANIIGVTTSGLARQLNLLRNLRSKLLICEEAGEVLEAHILTALLPSLEHVILIGDHLQLPPHVQNYELSRESHRGSQYSLDVSLFERLVLSKSSFPLSILETQRRMHPSISNLIRSTLYPALKDSPDVETYPRVAGMKRRLFWFDHNESEAVADPSRPDFTSHSNVFETKMVVALVIHLVRQGVYLANEIAVLTPYLGQLMKIRKALRGHFEITMNERDLQELERQGLNEESDDEIQPQTSIGKTALLKRLAVSTIDNFQGEEAKVVVISLVRSNDQNKCGFLKTSNRINVLLSRAKHGMYIIGNSQTSRHVKMWADVITMLQNEGNFGPYFELECARHPDTPILVSNPDDFVVFSPEGGCNKRCDKRLDCGHLDLSKCHSETLHKSVKCLEPCTRQLKYCDHGCPNQCGEKCVIDCQIILNGLNVELSCGHVENSMPCWQSRDVSTLRCKTAVEKLVPSCGHKLRVSCFVDVTSHNFSCIAICGVLLECGHTCQKPCQDCNTRVDGVITMRNHGRCQLVCGRKLTDCSHYCQLQCHGDTPCRCEAFCNNFCEHSRCARRCGEPCAPCAETTCASGKCPHSKVACSMPCAAPCDWLPCAKRCENVLVCGHQCPTICGEVCPPPQYCQVCADQYIRDLVVDFIEMSTYAEVDLNEDPVIIPACGHVLTTSSMDGQMEMSKHYAMDENTVIGIKDNSLPFSMQEVKVCGTCRGSLRNIARYGRIVRRALLDESTKKFIRWSGMKTISLHEALLEEQQRLTDLFENARDELPKKGHEIKITGHAWNQINTIKKVIPKRYKNIVAIRRQMEQHLSKVTVEEQPFKRVWDLVQYAKRSRDNVGEMAYDTGVLQTRETVQMTALLIRCDLIILSDVLEQMRTSDIETDLSDNRSRCERLVELAREANQPLHAAEGHIFHAQFIAAERQHCTAEDIDKLVNEAKAYLAKARDICQAYPGSTQRVVGELEDVEKMLRKSTFHSPMRDKEWREVMRAMATEFRGTGHWYTCQNGHPFTVGECGMPMEQARCPQCGATIGGLHHAPAAGVTRAEELEQRFSTMQM